MTEDKQIYDIEAVHDNAGDAIEPEIVSPGGGAGGNSEGPRSGRVFVKVYRPGPFTGLLALVGGVLLVAAIVSFGFIALIIGGVLGLVWLLLSPFLRLFRRG